MVDRGVPARGVLHRQVLAPNVLKNSGPLVVELYVGDTGAPMSFGLCVTR